MRQMKYELPIGYFCIRDILKKKQRQQFRYKLKSIAMKRNRNRKETNYYSYIFNASLLHTT